MKSKIITIGKSCGLIIPRAFRDQLGLNSGTPISLDVKNGTLIIRNIQNTPTEAELTEALEKIQNLLEYRDRTDMSKESLQALQKEILAATSGVLGCSRDDESN